MKVMATVNNRIQESIAAGDRIFELLDTVLTKGFEYDNQYKMSTKIGTYIDVNINAAAARDAAGQYIRTICMIGRINEPAQK